MTVAVKPAADPKTLGVVDDLVRRARAAMAAFADADQARVDEAVTALAWSLYNPAHAKELAELAVKDTGLGNVPDKVTKNQRKTFGTLRDLLRVKSVGIIEEDPARGIVKYAKPVGVVGAITPSTNPGATPVNKAMMAIKGRNAIIIAPSPAGLRTTTQAVDYMRAELTKIGAPADLVQILPHAASTKTCTQALMQAADLVVATGRQDNVRRAYRAARRRSASAPASAGDRRRDRRPRRCRAEDLRLEDLRQCDVVLVGEFCDARRHGLRQGNRRARARGRLHGCRRREDADPGGAVAGRQAQPDADRARMPMCSRAAAACPRRPNRKQFFMVEETGVGREFPFSGEKLALVLTVYRAQGFRRTRSRAPTGSWIIRAAAIRSASTPRTGPCPRAGRAIDVVRVLVNQAHTFGNGGGFDNGLQFHAQHGLRHLGRKFDHREPQLHDTSQHHPSRHHHPGGQAERGATVRRLLEKYGK